MVRRNTGREVILELPQDGQSTILGFDVSSSTIGWGLIARERPLRLLAHGHYRPPPSKHPFHHRLSESYDFIAGLCRRFNPDIVAVEEIALFVKGRSSARTITTLAFFNGAVSLSAFRELGGDPEKLRLYPVGRIRKLIKQACALQATPKKDEIPDLVRSSLDARFTSVTKRGSDEPAVQTNDEADGIAVAWACALDPEIA